MTRLELELSYEATYLGKMVLYDFDTAGRVESIAVEPPNTIVVLSIGGKLQRFEFPTEQIDSFLSIITNGDTDGRSRGDVFADL
jgi:hypothetical protein